MGRLRSTELRPEEVDGFAEDLKAFGYRPDQVEAARADFAALATPDEDFDVFAENEAAVRLFLTLRTQWRVAPLSTMARARLLHTGLDYGVIREAAALEGLELDLPADFRRLRIMEAEALVAFAEEARD